MSGLPRRLLKVSPLLLLVYILFIAYRQAVFERFLRSAVISFDDFPPKYAEALIAAQLGGRNVPNYTWPSVPVLDPGAQETIPPIIHFIWFKNLYHDHLDISTIPSVGSETPGICSNHNPGYEVLMWNSTAARSLLEDHYAWFLPTYDAYPHPIQRVDTFKYFVLWHYGGIYMDLDISCRRPLDALLAFPAWYPKASPFGVNNDLMASRARHPLTGFMLKKLTPRNKNLIFPYLTIYWSTGPQFTSDALKSWVVGLTGPLHNNGADKTHIDPDAIYVLPQEFYSEKYTFFGHRAGGTWHGWDVAMVLWLANRPGLFVLAPIVVFLIFFGALKLRLSRRVHEGIRDYR